MGVVTMFVPFVLAQLLHHCAPDVGPLTMSALVVRESGARPYAIDDDSTHRSYDFEDRAAALDVATRLLEAGHDIDVGYAQVNSQNFQAYGLDAERALDPCTNLAAAARILRTDYVAATRLFGPGQEALRHALSAYNTGSSWRGLRYAETVYATAARLSAREGAL